MKTQRFPIGTKYFTRGKHPRLCTVTDYHVTRNMRGEVVRARYVSEHDFLGQAVTNNDVCDTTVARGNYEFRVQAELALGMSRGDAQGIVDAQMRFPA